MLVGDVERLTKMLEAIKKAPDKILGIRLYPGQEDGAGLRDVVAIATSDHILMQYQFKMAANVVLADNAFIPYGAVGFLKLLTKSGDDIIPCDQVARYAITNNDYPNVKGFTDGAFANKQVDVCFDIELLMALWKAIKPKRRKNYPIRLTFMRKPDGTIDQQSAVVVRCPEGSDNLVMPVKI